MNAMTQALKEANLVPPLKKRIWMHLKENPKSSATMLASRLAAPIASVYAALNELERRQMVVVERFKDHGCRMGNPNRAMYSVDPSMRGEFEMLPLPTTTALRPAPVVPPSSFKSPSDLPITMADIDDALSEPQRRSADELDLDSMTLGQLRAIYQRLDKIFRAEAA